MSIPLLVEMAALTPLIEEPCDKNGLFLVSSGECRMSNKNPIRHRTGDPVCTLHSTLYYQILASFTGYVCLAFH